MSEGEMKEGKKGGQVWKGVIRKVKFGKTKEYNLIKRAHFPGEDQIEDIVAKVKNSNIVTATELAEHFDLKVSTCRRILKFMKDEGALRETSFSSSGMRMYEPIGEE